MADKKGDKQMINRIRNWFTGLIIRIVANNIANNGKIVMALKRDE